MPLLMLMITLHFARYAQGFVTLARLKVASESLMTSHGCSSTVVDRLNPARLHCLQIFQQL